MKTFKIEFRFNAGGSPLSASVQAKNLPDALNKWAKMEGVTVESSQIFRDRNWRSIGWFGHYIRPDYVSASAASTPVSGTCFAA